MIRADLGEAGRSIDWSSLAAMLLSLPWPIRALRRMNELTKAEINLWREVSFQNSQKHFTFPDCVLVHYHVRQVALLRLTEAPPLDAPLLYER
jgi:hypothetical protein